MKCPMCKEPDLIMSERQSVEIDYCPKCRGVWLDRGELDKIIEKSLMAPVPRDASVEIPRPPADPYYEGHGYYDDHHRHGDHRWGKKKSWLGDLFD